MRCQRFIFGPQVSHDGGVQTHLAGATCSCFQNRQSHRGTSSLEILIAFTLLSTVLSLSTPLVVKHGRLLAAQRDYRLALDELSNQLERLTALPADELPAALQRLAPSPFIETKLVGAEIRGELEATDIGRRLTLRLWWDEPQRAAAPVAMAAWIMPDTTKPSGQQPGSESR